MKIAVGLPEVGLASLDDAGRIRYADDPARRLLGLRGDAPDDAEGTPGVTLRRSLERLLERARAEPQSEHCEEVTLDDAGATRRARLSLHTIPHDPPSRFLLVVEDPEAVAGLDRDLREANRFRALAAILAGVAHDARSPLNALTLNLELLRRQVGRIEMDEAARAKAERSLGTMGAQLDRLARLVQLGLEESLESKSSSGPVDLRGTIATVVQLAGTFVRKRGVRLEQQSAGEAPVMVHAREDRLQHVLIELIVNACDAMEGEGRLSLALDVESDEAKVTIADSGPGIRPERLDRIFERHVTTKEAGRGIGLWVGRRIAEEHGGTLTVAADPDGGTAFTLTLPLAGNTPEKPRAG